MESTPRSSFEVERQHQEPPRRGPSKSEKLSAAQDLYIKAANQYKIAKCYEKAGQAFADAGQLYLESNHGNYSAASNFTKAAEMYRKTNKAAAVKNLERSVKLFLDDGKFSSAAKNKEQVAEIAAEDGRHTDSIIAYEKAADYYEAENSPSSASACLLKAGYLSVDVCEYEKAITIFEKVAGNYVNNTLTNFKCKQLFFEAQICRMFLGDLVDCRKSLGRYLDLKNDFIKTREYTMLEGTLTAFENFDADQYSAAVTEFDSVQPLQRWQTTVLLAIKDRIEKEANQEEDLT